MGLQRAEELLESPGREAIQRPPRAMDGGGSHRILGVEVARALAIVGMLSVHIGPTRGDAPAELLYALPHGRASLLFVLVAGIGVSLLAASPRVSALDARTRLAWRAVLLLPLGLLLQELDIDVLVILQTYGALFLLAMLVLGLRDRWLLALAGLSAVAGPIVILTLEVVSVQWHPGDPTSLSDPAGFVARGLLLSGGYPLVTWAAPFLFGMWLGRRDLRRRSLQVALLGYGAAVALAAGVLSRVLGRFVEVSDIIPTWERLIVDVPHSQMPLWLWGGTAAAAMVLGLSLLAAEAARKALWPLVALGQLALTAYVAHLLALHFWPETLTGDTVGEAVVLLAVLTGLGLIFAVAWRAAFARGPLEALLNTPWAAAAKLRRGNLRQG